MSTNLPNKNSFLLSVVIPVYNEEDCLHLCVNRLQDVLKTMACQYELVFVNDGSTDHSLEILQAEKLGDLQIRIISLSRNFGHQIAITAGMDNSKGDAVIIIDADLQDPPELFPELVKQWQAGNDIVHARRRNREGESNFKRQTAKIFYRLLKQISNIEIPVDVGDFRLMSRRTVDAFLQLQERHRYVRGLIAWLGYKQTFVDYDRAPRLAGTTKYPLLKMLRLSVDGIASFSVLPLRLASLCGLLCALAAALYTCYALYIKFIKHEAVVGWTSIIMAVLFVGGIQLICLGIIGEYVGILHEEMKKRPLYLISKID